MDMNLWNINTEIDFFEKALKTTHPKKLFYQLGDSYYAFIPKGKADREMQTLQSRNSLIGEYAEKWAKNLFSPIAQKHGLFALNSVVCEEIGLSKKSSADMAFCAKNSMIQQPADIKLLFEIKMSIVSNYSYTKENGVNYIGDYFSHTGNPSLLRSDSMLKAIGKSINVRVTSDQAAKIPIIILGNSPIGSSYKEKIDRLKSSGVVQGFWSLNPLPTNKPHLTQTERLGFQTINNEKKLYELVSILLSDELNFFINAA